MLLTDFYLTAMSYQLSIISDKLLEDYGSQVPVDLKEKFELLHDAELSTNSFSFSTSVASR